LIEKGKMVTRSRGRRQSKDKDEGSAANTAEEEVSETKTIGRQRKTAAQKKKEAAQSSGADDDAPVEESQNVGRKTRGRGKQAKADDKDQEEQKKGGEQEVHEEVRPARRGRRAGRQKSTESPALEQAVGNSDPKLIDKEKTENHKIDAQDMGKLSAAERRKLKKKMRKQTKKLERCVVSHVHL
jgi:hypothetical protein